MNISLFVTLELLRLPAALYCVTQNLSWTIVFLALMINHILFMEQKGGIFQELITFHLLYSVCNIYFVWTILYFKVNMKLNWPKMATTISRSTLRTSYAVCMFMYIHMNACQHIRSVHTCEINHENMLTQPFRSVFSRENHRRPWIGHGGSVELGNGLALLSVLQEELCQIRVLQKASCESVCFWTYVVVVIYNWFAGEQSFSHTFGFTCSRSWKMKAQMATQQGFPSFVIVL